jgi:hypothetical protein
MNKNVTKIFVNHRSILLLLISFAVYKILVSINGTSWNSSYEISENIFLGKPVFYTWHNRLLSSYLPYYFSKIFGLSYMWSWKIIYFFSIVTQIFISSYILKKLGYTNFCCLIFNISFFFIFSFLNYQNHYLWDIFDLNIFSIFVFIIINNKHWLYCVLIFFIAILNRENAIVICFFLLLDSINIKLFFKNKLYNKSLKFIVKKVNKIKFITGLFLIIFFYNYNKYLRYFRSEKFGFHELHGEIEIAGNHLVILENLKMILRVDKYYINTFFSLFLFYCCYLAISSIRRFSDVQIKILCTILFLIICNLFFSFWPEWRVHSVVFLLFFYLLLSKKNIFKLFVNKINL